MPLIDALDPFHLRVTSLMDENRKKILEFYSNFKNPLNFEYKKSVKIQKFEVN